MLIKFINKNIYTLFLFLLMLLVAFLLVNNMSTDKENFVSIEVKSGESIWSLSEEYGNMSHLTQKQFVKWIENNNDISSNRLQVGQEIVLPIKKEKEHLLASR